jgi:hypothetical protein
MTWRALRIVALALLLPTSAHAELTLYWDCYLPTSNVDCAVMESSLTSKIPFLKTVPDPAQAEVVVTLSSIPAENATRYRLDFVGQRLDGYATEVHTTDKIPADFDATAALVRLMTKLERGLSTFMDQKIAGEMIDGRLTLQLVDPTSLPFRGRPEQQGVKWYLSPSLGTYFSDVQGVGVNTSGIASINYNYSGDLWRVQTGIGTSYNRQSQPVPGTSQTASIDFVGLGTTDIFSRSFGADRKWSGALLFGAEKNPQANYKARANASAGLEMDLIPRQTVNQRNLGFRCAAGAEFQRYDAVNVEGLEEQVVGRESCDVFFLWHFRVVDLGAGLGETVVLKDIAFRSFSASFSATVRVTDNLLLSLWVNAQQINQAINEGQPSDVVYSDPRQEIEASMLAAVQQGYTAPFGIQSGLSLRYLFGNGSLSLEDQRWKNATALR